MVADVDTLPGSHLPSWRSDLLVGVVSRRGEISRNLLACLQQEGITFGPATAFEALDALLLDVVEEDRPAVEDLARSNGNAPGAVIAAISPEILRAPALTIATDDVIVVPWRPGELTVRVRRLIGRAGPRDEPGVIRADDLVIDSNRYDVFLAGKAVFLTFKEYELLKLLAANRGRVYSREALLEQIWGYQYFGGTRTVDVHIRRLRSKIEDATHTFIDTVWNVGYRFRGQPS